ncbi:MAG: DinB family protein [Nocardioidaceae bacterium]
MSTAGTSTGGAEPERHSEATQYPDMWVDPDDDPRSEGGFTDERSLLIGYLRDYRLTLRMKCDGLDAEQMARRSVPPSTMSLLGLVRHLAKVEHSWFRRVMEGTEVPRIYWSEADRDLDFNEAVADPEVVEDAWATWRAEVANAERFVDETADLGRMDPKGEIALREVLLHMIEEYARHCGHADLLRERIDGRVGQ